MQIATYNMLVLDFQCLIFQDLLGTECSWKIQRRTFSLESFIVSQDNSLCLTNISNVCSKVETKKKFSWGGPSRVISMDTYIKHKGITSLRPLVSTTISIPSFRSVLSGWICVKWMQGRAVLEKPRHYSLVWALSLVRVSIHWALYLRKISIRR